MTRFYLCSEITDSVRHICHSVIVISLTFPSLLCVVPKFCWVRFRCSSKPRSRPLSFECQVNSKSEHHAYPILLSSLKQYPMARAVRNGPLHSCRVPSRNIFISTCPILIKGTIGSPHSNKGIHPSPSPSNLRMFTLTISSPEGLPLTIICTF